MMPGFSSIEQMNPIMTGEMNTDHQVSDKIEGKSTSYAEVWSNGENHTITYTFDTNI